MQITIGKTERFELQMDVENLQVVPQTHTLQCEPFQSHVTINQLIAHYASANYKEHGVAVIRNAFFNSAEEFVTPELTVIKNGEATVFSVKLGVVNFIVIALPE